VASSFRGLASTPRAAERRPVPGELERRGHRRAVRRVGDAANERVPAASCLLAARPLGVLELREDVTRGVEGGVRVVERRSRGAPTAERRHAKRNAQVGDCVFLSPFGIRRFRLRARFETRARLLFVCCVIFRGERRPRGVLQVVLQRQDVPGGREPGLGVGRESFCRVRAVASRGGDGGGDVRGDAVGDVPGTRALRTGARLRGRGVRVRELAEILFVFVAEVWKRGQRASARGKKSDTASRGTRRRFFVFSLFLGPGDAPIAWLPRRGVSLISPHALPRRPLAGPPWPWR
jgi:hypothetical protein